MSLSILLIVFGIIQSQISIAASSTILKSLTSKFVNAAFIDVPEGDPYDPSQAPPNSVMRCPTTGSCLIYCQDERSCQNKAIMAGPRLEVFKLHCEFNACRNLTLVTMTPKNELVCMDENSCPGAHFLCGTRAPPSIPAFLAPGASPSGHVVDSCDLKCQNGGCIKSTFTCIGNVKQCNVFANSAASFAHYHTVAGRQVGSFTGGTFNCLSVNPAAQCNLECSDTLQRFYCAGSKYNCQAPNALIARNKCVCSDYCSNSALGPQARCQTDCPSFNIRPQF